MPADMVPSLLSVLGPHFFGTCLAWSWKSLDLEPCWGCSGNAKSCLTLASPNPHQLRVPGGLHTSRKSPPKTCWHVVTLRRIMEKVVRFFSLQREQNTYSLRGRTQSPCAYGGDESG